MAKPNFRHQKRQREEARKQRQVERLQRRGERPAVDESEVLTSKDVTPTGGST